MIPEYAAALVDGSPMDFLSIDNEILDEMVFQTNLYATQVLMSEEDVSECSRMHDWSPTDKDELKKILGIMGYMGMVKMPTIRHYWSTKPLFKNSVVSNIMSRNRFELLLKFWHLQTMNCAQMATDCTRWNNFSTALFRNFSKCSCLAKFSV